MKRGIKAFFESFFTRIGDLIIKNISMKVESAAVVTYVYMANKENLGTVGFSIVVVMWLAVVGLRYAEKVQKLLPASFNK